MKKLVLLLSAAVLLAAANASAQLIQLIKVDALQPMGSGTGLDFNYTFTLNRNGPVSVYFDGNLGRTHQNATSVEYSLWIDGNLMLDTGNLGPQHEQYLFSGNPGDMAAGTHTVRFHTSGQGTHVTGILLAIATNEPPQGIQQAIDELTAAYQAADAAMQAAILAQLNAINTALQNQINQNSSDIAALQQANADLTARIAALEQSQTSQDELIAQLQTQLAANQTRLSELENALVGIRGDLTILQERMDSLDLSTQTRSVVLTNFYPTPGSKRSGLKSTDYLIMGGIAAGATGLGIGIYSLFDENPAVAVQEPDDVNHSSSSKDGQIN
jgi:signal transduction histidine kinase